MVNDRGEACVFHQGPLPAGIDHVVWVPALGAMFLADAQGRRRPLVRRLPAHVAGALGRCLRALLVQLDGPRVAGGMELALRVDTTARPARDQRR